MKFTDKRTQKFIGRWKTSEEEVKALRQELNELVEKTDFSFAYCEKKLSTIDDSAIRARSATAVQEKKASFSAASVRTGRVIDDLEVTIARGNDVISGLEIAGVLNSVDEEVVALDRLNHRAREKLPELDGLINEGQGLLELELGALGV